jgi:hypothetical protein
MDFHLRTGYLQSRRRLLWFRRTDLGVAQSGALFFVRVGTRASGARSLKRRLDVGKARSSAGAGLQEITFEHGGRKYVCTVEAQRRTPEDRRWWFAVGGDEQRYSPIEAAPNDTANSVRTRIIEFYERHLWLREQPAAPRGAFGQPGRPGRPRNVPKTDDDE